MTSFKQIFLMHMYKLHVDMYEQIRQWCLILTLACKVAEFHGICVKN